MHFNSSFIVSTSSFLQTQAEDRPSGLPASPAEIVANACQGTRYNGSTHAPDRAIDPMPSDVARACRAIYKAGLALPSIPNESGPRAACSFGRILEPVIMVDAFLSYWHPWAKRESNPLPSDYQSDALPLSYSRSSLHAVPKLFTERSW